MARGPSSASRVVRLTTGITGRRGFTGRNSLVVVATNMPMNRHKAAGLVGVRLVKAGLASNRNVNSGSIVKGTIMTLSTRRTVTGTARSYVLILGGSSGSCAPTFRGTTTMVIRTNNLADRTTIINVTGKVPMVMKTRGTASLIRSGRLVAVSSHHNVVCHNTAAAVWTRLG